MCDEGEDGCDDGDDDSKPDPILQVKLVLIWNALFLG